jgi:hypothetical protein
MNKTSKRRNWWIVVAGIVMALMLVWFSPLRRPVVALYDMQHSIDVFLRFHSETLEKTAAGLYYSDLMMEHGYEQYEILQAHPEHFDEFWHVVELFTPGIEALTDGQGDTVLITEEHINSLKKEWEWESQFASDSMREDIEKELQRFPLETFIGMTFSEVWDSVNANFSPDLALTTPTPRPVVTPVCLVGIDSACLSMPVVGTDGQWAHYTWKGIYFEYPADWRVEDSDGHYYLNLIPAPDSPEAQDVLVIHLSVWGVSEESGKDNPLFPFNDEKYQIHWQKTVPLVDLAGEEFLWEYTSIDEYIYLEARFYEPEARQLIELLMWFYKDKMNPSIYDPEKVAEQYPNYQHLMESLQYQTP